MRDDLQVLCSRKLAVGCVKWPDGRRTVLVKLTLEPTSEGALVLAAEQPDASLDVTGAHGEVLVPGDFAPYKPACDVVVIERSASARAEPGQLAVGATRIEVGPRDSLGPRATFCPDGDPSDPESEALWSQPGAEFNRFQSAEPQRRIPYPRVPLDVSFQRGLTNLRWRFTGPLPRGYQLSPDASAVEFVLPLALDTVLVDPALARATLVFRGVMNPRANGLVAIDASWDANVDVGRLRGFLPVKPTWPRSSSTSASATPRSPQHQDETRAISGPLPASVLPFGAPSSLASGAIDAEEATVAVVAPSSPVTRSAARPIVEEGAAVDVTRVAVELDVAANETAPLMRGRASTLPFAHAAHQDAPARRKLTAEELAELREREAAPSSPWGQDETHAVAARSEPAPRQPLEQVRMMQPPLRYAAPVPGPSALRSEHLVQPEPLFEHRKGGRLDPSEAPAASLAGATEVPLEELVAEVQREIWKATEPLATILERRGLTEAAWRDLKKRSKGR